MYPFATSTCVASGATTTCVYMSATSTPLYVQDAGDLQYGLAWIIFFLAMIFLGMVWNIVPFRK